MKKKPAFIMMLLAFSGMLAIAEDAPKNLLVNSDFCQATEPGYPDFWDGASGWLPGTHELVDGGFIEGTKSMLLIVKGKSPVKLFTGNFGWSPGKPDTPYVFTVYMKAEPAGQKVTIGNKRFKLETVTVSGEWQRYSAIGTLDKLSGFAGRFLTPEITLDPGVAGGKVWVNAPMLHIGTSEVPYIRHAPKKSSQEATVGIDKAVSAFWRLDNIQNGIVKDLSGNGLDGQLVGTFSKADTKDGCGMKFTGEEYITIPHNSKLDVPNNELAVEILFTPEPKNAMPIIMHGMPWGGYALMLSYNKLNPVFGAWKGFLTQPCLPESTHLIMSYKKPNAECYINGVPEKTELLNSDILPDCQKRAFIIGGTETVRDNSKGYESLPGFHGVISYVKVYSRAVTPDEAKALYSNRKENLK